MREKTDYIKIFTDGGARGNPGPAAAAYIVYMNKVIIAKDAIYLGKSTNNIAEYMAVLEACKWLTNNLNKYNVKDIFFYIDSELVVKQLTGVYKIKNNNIKKLILKIKSSEKQIAMEVFYKHIFRSKNRLADKLVNQKLDQETANLISRH